MQNRHNELDKELARLKALAEENKKDFEHKQTRDQQLQTKLVRRFYKNVSSN